MNKPIRRKVTNIDPGGPQLSGKTRKGGPRKSIWFVDSVTEEEDIYGGPSRYGPKREYIANCASEEIATQFVAAWNQLLMHLP